AKRSLRSVGATFSCSPRATIPYSPSAMTGATTPWCSCTISKERRGKSVSTWARRLRTHACWSISCRRTTAARMTAGIACCSRVTGTAGSAWAASTTCSSAVRLRSPPTLEKKYGRREPPAAKSEELPSSDQQGGRALLGWHETPARPKLVAANVVVSRRMFGDRRRCGSITLCFVRERDSADNAVGPDPPRGPGGLYAGQCGVVRRWWGWRVE